MGEISGAGLKFVLAPLMTLPNRTRPMTAKAILDGRRTVVAVRIANLQPGIRWVSTRKAKLASDSVVCRELANQHPRLADLVA